MTDISFMNHDERVFLAGCIETIIVADSNIEENELENLDRTIKELNFKNFDDCLCGRQRIRRLKKRIRCCCRRQNRQR